jgi:protein-tyrosine phosphatase
MKNLGLIPIRNFGVVLPDKHLYRSAQPLYRYEYKWLKDTVGIKRIINLRSEKNVDDKFCKEVGIESYSILVPDHKSPSLEQVQEFYNLIKDTKLPTLIHCEHGHGRTSTFSVLSKLLFGWTLDAALLHEKDKFHYNFKHHAQEEFLKDFYKVNFKVV